MQKVGPDPLKSGGEKHGAYLFALATSPYPKATTTLTAPKINVHYLRSNACL